MAELVMVIVMAAITSNSYDYGSRVNSNLISWL
jgi:hypothetical protein